MNTSDDDNTLSEMSMSIRGKMARGDGEATKRLSAARNNAPLKKEVNDIEMNDSEPEDDDDEDEEEEEDKDDSDTQRDKLLHVDDADKNKNAYNKDSKKQSDIESGVGNS